MLLSLTILAILLTGFIWAYWNSGEVLGANIETESNTIEIGTGSTEEVKTSLTAIVDSKDPHAILLPETVDEDQSKVTILYEVSWTIDSELISGAKGTLHFDNAELVIKGEENSKANEVLAELFSVQFNNDGKVMTIDEKETVFVTVSFDKEPANKQEYELIAGKELVLKFNLEVQAEE